MQAHSELTHKTHTHTYANGTQDVCVERAGRDDEQLATVANGEKEMQSVRPECMPDAA